MTTLEDRKRGLFREAWIQNVIRALKYTREKAEEAHDRIFNPQNQRKI